MLTNNHVLDYLNHEVDPPEEVEGQTVYIGRGVNEKRRVHEEDAFDVAITESLSTYESMIEFRQNFDRYFQGQLTSSEYKEFRAQVVEWFYSGDWTEGEIDV